MLIHTNNGPLDSRSRSMSSIHLAQSEFDRKYITRKEVCERLDISKAAFQYGKHRGWLPEAIVIQGTMTHLYLRDEAEPMIRQWEKRKNGEIPYPPRKNARNHKDPC